MNFNNIVIMLGNVHFAGKTFDTIDPRSGKVIAEVSEGGQDDIDLSVKAAREAFDHGKWPRMSGYVRILSIAPSLSPLIYSPPPFTRLPFLNLDY